MCIQLMTLMNLKPTLKPENIKLNAYLDVHRMDNVALSLPECPKTGNKVLNTESPHPWHRLLIQGMMILNKSKCVW